MIQNGNIIHAMARSEFEVPVAKSSSVVVVVFWTGLGPLRPVVNDRNLNNLRGASVSG